MPMYLRQISVLFSLLALLGACRQMPLHEEEGNALERKTEPYDLFAFQRSYPDSTFDYKAWRNALQNARETATTAQQSRSNGCQTPAADWTLQGPGNVAGRLNTLAASPVDENTVLAGFSGGGIFRTTDSGQTWTAVFDEQPELSIAHIAFDPSDPNTVYAGTGDPNIPSNVFNGNGLYKSTDGGQTWAYFALADKGILSKVAVDPDDPNTIYVASMGNPYIRDQNRGIFKTTDGGQNWDLVLSISDQAGASDLLLNPQNPQILYASFWDRVRSNKESIIYGPHARIYKTTDGGQNWTRLEGGLPTGNMGRTGLAMSAQNPDKIYAIYVDTLSRPGGLYKTTDGGQNWTPMNINGLHDAYADFGWYFGKVRVNAYDDEDVYILGILLWRKASGSNGWHIGAGAHADCHDLIFMPSGKRYLATDGGMYTNLPGQMNWTKSKNLPTTQFYRTNFNPHQPGTYFAGAQDNGIQKGNGNGFNNWVSVFAADGFRSAFHPQDPDRFWIETQNGSIHRTINGGNNWTIGQSCFGTNDRCNWDAPFFISPHGPDWLYGATFRVYASTDGQSWGTVSGDLTDGNVYGARFHNISALSESPITEQKLFAGTSDGNVWFRTPAGLWTNITPGLPDRYVTSVWGSPTHPDRIFVTHSGYRDNEEIPHIHRSDNNGQTWQNISSDLPPVPVNDLLVLPGHADSVLFAATDAGVYISRNSGQNWQRLGQNMPIIPVFDLEHNPTHHLLAAATFARGIWTYPIDSVFTAGEPVTVRLAGAITTESGSPVTDVKIENVISNPDGLFELASVPGCDSIQIEPYRDDNPINGVTTFDLLLISKHILNIEAIPSPYKMIAADANKSGSITTFDIVVLRKLILGIDTFFQANTSWRFVPADYSFLDPQNPFPENFPEYKTVQTGSTDFSGCDFIGIKTGDLNGTALGAPGAPATAERLGPEKKKLRLKTVYRETERSFLEVLTGDEPLAALQFGLQFDSASVQNLSVEPLALGATEDHFALHPNAITAALEFPTGLNPSTPLCRIWFDGKPEFTLTDRPTPGLWYSPDGRAFRIELQTEPAGSFTCSPNPFGPEGLTIRHGQPAANPAIGIYNLEGKLIYEVNPAEQQTHVPAQVFPGPGAYLVRSGATTQKVIFTGH